MVPVALATWRTAQLFIAGGIATGDFGPHVDPELAAVAMLGAIFYLRLMTPTAQSPDEAATLVSSVLG